MSAPARTRAVTGPGRTRDRLARMLSGFIPVQLVYVMARLRLADFLAEGSKTIEELSASANAQPSMMLRLVRGLAGVGLVGVEGDGRVWLTAMGGSSTRGRPDPCGTWRSTAEAKRSPNGESSSTPSGPVSPRSRRRTETRSSPICGTTPRRATRSTAP
jgi:hypothetical protein